jgi:hypothetical protein
MTIFFAMHWHRIGHTKMLYSGMLPKLRESTSGNTAFTHTDNIITKRLGTSKNISRRTKFCITFGKQQAPHVVHFKMQLFQKRWVNYLLLI